LGLAVKAENKAKPKQDKSRHIPISVILDGVERLSSAILKQPENNFQVRLAGISASVDLEILTTVLTEDNFYALPMSLSDRN
jgi:hypothetical protein